jgi:DNA mismatch endonuclease (patch repair protein)
MAKVQSKGNRSTELRLIELFKKARVKGWRRGVSLLGKPDFVFPKPHLAVFVDGCFWHGCLRHCRIPNTRRHYWVTKIEANKARDREVTRSLKKSGWRVLRIWEHDVTPQTLVKVIKKFSTVENIRSLAHGG